MVKQGKKDFKKYGRHKTRSTTPCEHCIARRRDGVTKAVRKPTHPRHKRTGR